MSWCCNVNHSCALRMTSARRVRVVRLQAVFAAFAQRDIHTGAFKQVSKLFAVSQGIV